MKAPVNFCQVCGHAMSDRVIYGRQRRVCPACGYVHFDDPKVAAVVFVEREQRVLLVQRAMNPERGKWALPGGYVDFGEDPAQAAVREVYEETGIRVTITELVAVRSNGGPIVITYAAQAEHGTPFAGDDAHAVRWFSAHEALPELAFESTRTMLEDWIRRQRASTSQ